MRAHRQEPQRRRQLAQVAFDAVATTTVPPGASTRAISAPSARGEHHHDHGGDSRRGAVAGARRRPPPQHAWVGAGGAAGRVDRGVEGHARPVADRRRQVVAGTGAEVDHRSGRRIRDRRRPAPRSAGRTSRRPGSWRGRRPCGVVAARRRPGGQVHVALAGDVERVARGTTHVRPRRSRSPWHTGHASSPSMPPISAQRQRRGERRAACRGAPLDPAQLAARRRLVDMRRRVRAVHLQRPRVASGGHHAAERSGR